MARVDRRLEANVEGDFYVDDTCIDCGACRWIAPEVFDYQSGYSRVFRQPSGEAEEGRALAALVSCPTASIGAEGENDVAGAAGRFPRRMDDRVLHCGYHAESSFGATSWLLLRPTGNVLVDSPRFNHQLARGIDALGGARFLFLTHRDDVADHVRWADRLGCERIIHAADRSGGTRDVERVVEGEAPVVLDEGLTMIPTPGHTRGSACLHADDRYLFTGDHLAWRISEDRLVAFRRACWYDWPTQIESMERLRDFRFEWVLPGHGAPVELPADRMADELAKVTRWMREVA